MSDVNVLFEQAAAGVNGRLRAISDDLDGTSQYIRNRFMPTVDAGGWGQFLQEDNVPTATGTACIISSLARMGAGRRDSQMVAAATFLCADQRTDGGWSKPSLADELSLNLVTCLSLNALESAGIGAGHPVVAKGLEWLQNARNADGGWGNIPRDGQSDVTSTAYALRTLTSQDLGAQFGPTLELGVTWIAQQQNEDGGWGIRRGESSSLAHTAHAAEGLIAAGYTELASDARQWLLERVPTASLAPWDEHYQFPLSIEAQLSLRRRRQRLRWTHLPAQRSVIALMKLGVDPTDSAVSALVAEVESCRDKVVCWKVQTIPEAAASWAILESVNALVGYRDAMESIRQVAAFREVIHLIVPRVEALEAENIKLHEKVEALTRVVSKLSAHGRAMRFIRRVSLAPETHFFLILIVAVALLLFYLSLWSRGSDAGARLIGVATIAAPILALLEMVRRRKKKEL